MKRSIAIILTAYNRRDITRNGLLSLMEAIKVMGGDYFFDVYMTDDGSTDGTSEAIMKEFPQVIILQGNGSLFWGGGMNLAWKKAAEKDYDYYLWWNDDSILFPTALKEIFKPIGELGDNTIVSGAFQDDEGRVSYGGCLIDMEFLSPNGKIQQIRLMNGNMTLIPKNVFAELGFIDRHFPHGGGDYDYGLRAIEKGVSVVLTKEYVGICNRHDNVQVPYIDRTKTLRQRIKSLYGPKYSARTTFYYNRRYYGLYRAIRVFVTSNLVAFFPELKRERIIK